MPADLVAILDTLRLQLLSLSITAPYYRARLRRITQQLDYVVQAWPAEDWPVRPPASAQPLLRQLRPPVPTRQQLRAHLQELEEILQDENPLVEHPQQLLNLLLFFL